MADLPTIEWDLACSSPHSWSNDWTRGHSWTFTFIYGQAPSVATTMVKVELLVCNYHDIQCFQNVICITLIIGCLCIPDSSVKHNHGLLRLEILWISPYIWEICTSSFLGITLQLIRWESLMAKVIIISNGLGLNITLWSTHMGLPFTLEFYHMRTMISDCTEYSYDMRLHIHALAKTLAKLNRYSHGMDG